jgi:D-serine deaminase-like pyridoxal phosphate-dependent protein
MQEHGILSPPEGMHAEDARTFLRDHGEALMGSLLTIRPQHACLTCAAHPWYYIVNGPDEDIVRDIWVPWKGW